MIGARPSIAPSWSRDGRLLAIAGAGAGPQPSDGDIAFIDVDTGTQQSVPLPSNAVRGFGWLDETTLIVNAALPNSALQLHQLSYPSGQLNPLTRDVNDYDGISVAADGQTLICARRERRTELSILDAAGRTIADGPGIDVTGSRTGVTAINWAGERVLFGEWIWQPGASPQRFLDQAGDTTAEGAGRTLVFRKGNGLWKAANDGGPQTELVTGDAWNPAVTPDNRWVIFLSSRTGLQSPWIISIDGGEPRQLVNRFAAGPGVDISPDGKSIVFASRDEKLSSGVVVVCELDGCQQQKIFRKLGLVRVRWTPDGRAITYVDALTQSNLWTIGVVGGTSTR